MAGGATGVRLGHLVVRDCRVEGIAVRANGAADVVNATLVGNAIAVRAAGTTRMRNSLLTGNGTAAASDTAGALASTYNNLYGNQADYAGASAGTGDFSIAVTFSDFAVRDLRLPSAQPSTDRGDPADAVGAEPAPHGGRINLGAFGGTADAELTDPSTTDRRYGHAGRDAGDRSTRATATGATPTPTLTRPRSSGDDDDGGCRIAGRTDGSGRR